METKEINKLFLKTAFSCIACDGDIDPKELSLLKNLHQKDKLFGEINLEDELNKLIDDLNKNGFGFLRDFLLGLTQAEISQDEQLKIINIAVRTIEADDEIKYSEIKFFKLLRSKLTIENNYILEKYPHYEEYLEEDVFSKSYLDKIEGDYFNISNLNQLKLESIEIKDLPKNDKK